MSRLLCAACTEGCLRAFTREAREEGERRRRVGGGCVERPSFSLIKVFNKQDVMARVAMQLCK